MDRSGVRLTRARIRYLVEAVLLLGLALAVFVPGGCSHSPVGPEQTLNTFLLPNGIIAHPGTVLPGNELAIDAPYTIPIRVEDTTVKEEGIWKDTIDSDGGVIAMELEGTSSFFTVAPEGLEEKTEIRVTLFRLESAVDKRITEYHFEPDGLTFRNASLLSLNTILKDGEKLELLYWDPAAGKWLKSAEAVVVNGYATFPILHFSDYRTTERVSLGGQRGGQ